MRKVILFELNEVPFRVIDKCVSQDSAANFAWFENHADLYITHCEDVGRLDPWISWPSLHRGVNNRMHEIEHLGQVTRTADRRYAPLWRLAHSAGAKVGVCGSLFSSSIPDDIERYAFYLPDYFASEQAGSSDSLTRLHAFNLAMTRESGLTVSRRVPTRLAVDFLKNHRRWGVKPATLAQLGKQLLIELGNKATKNRRRSLQSLLLFDAFYAALENTKPDVCCYYTNNVAAAMHRFWAAFFPEDFDPHPFPQEWRDRFEREIPLAMGVVDALLGRLRRFVDSNPEYLLMVASSMGQAAIPTKPTKSVFTIVDMERFAKVLGLDSHEWTERPAMVPCRALRIEPDRTGAVRARLHQLRLGDHLMTPKQGYAGPFGFDQREDGYFHIHVEFFDYDGPWQLTVGNNVIPSEEAGLGQFYTDFDVINTAQHHEEGSLIIYDPQQQKRSPHRTEISVLDIAPTILQSLDIGVPNYMMGSAIPRPAAA